MAYGMFSPLHVEPTTLIDAQLRQRIEQYAGVITAPPEQVLFRPGDPCSNFLLITEGTARVEMVARNGRELVLYRVHPGETCALTINCLLGKRPYQAQGIADTELTALALPVSRFDELLAESAEFRLAVFEAFGERIERMMARIEEVLAHGLDPRLAQLLLSQCDEAGYLNLTHYRIAVELAAAREAVSRRLKGYERAGWIRLGRGHIEILDRAALAVLAEPAEETTAAR